MSGDLQPFRPDPKVGLPRRVVGRLIDVDQAAELEPHAEPAPFPVMVPAPARGRWVWLSGHATPRVRQHAGDAVVIAYVVAIVVVCTAVASVAYVVAVAAWHVIAWMGGPL